MVHSPPSCTLRADYLLIIGIDKYKEVSPLHNAVKDSKAVCDVLIAQYAFEKSDLIELYNENATRENIIEAFDELSEKITQDDNLLIYYAGHGYYRRNLKLGYWVSPHLQILYLFLHCCQMMSEKDFLCLVYGVYGLHWWCCNNSQIFFGC